MQQIKENYQVSKNTSENKQTSTSTKESQIPITVPLHSKLLVAPGGHWFDKVIAS